MTATPSVTDVSEYLDSRRLTIAPSGETLVGVGHALQLLESLVARIRAEGGPGAVPPPGHVILHGPPGTGKTATTRWFLGLLGDRLPIYDLPCESLSPELIRQVFSHLADRPRSIVLLSEVDALGMSRALSDSPEQRATLFALLESIDPVVTVSPGLGPLILASTNNLHQLDDALLRPGRLGIHVRLSYPTSRERASLLQTFAQPWLGEPQPDWTRLAQLTARTTPAELRGIVHDAVGIALLRDGHGTTLTDADLLTAVRRGTDIVAERPDRDPTRTAHHEAGHVLCASAMGLPVRAVTIETGHRGGRTETADEDDPLTAREIWASAITALGGIAAEELFLGTASMGGESDVAGATQLLIRRIECGLDPLHPPVSRRAWGHGWTPVSLDDSIGARVASELAVARTEATVIVNRERDAIGRLAEQLLVTPVMSGADIERFLAGAYAA